MTTAPNRRWYQFGLRTVLIVMTLLCVGPGGYVAYEQAKARQQKKAVEAIEKLARIQFAKSAYPRSALTRWMLGDETFENVVWVDFITSVEENRSYNEVELRNLRSFPQLKCLILDGCTQFTDSGLREISGLQNLQELYLAETPISDAGLPHIANLKKLTHLSLNETQVTDTGLTHLAKLTTLEFLDLGNTRVTPAGIANLRKLLPNCHIDTDS